ncbi:hypothetical protein SNEBB_006687 [Seison nebaliae]|nr:hypothetical protein SNEBB_006687 [Seison nebaliae]
MLFIFLILCFSPIKQTYGKPNIWDESVEFYERVFAKKQTYNINTLPVEHPNHLCTNDVVRRGSILKARGTRIYNMDPRVLYMSHQIGTGGQGTTYAISKLRKIVYVMKVTFHTELALFEANALYGKSFHPISVLPKYELRKIASSDMDTHMQTRNIVNENITLNSYKKIVCLFTHFLEGKAMNHNTDLPPLSNNLSRFLTFFIIMLKQIQAIHFTINHYKYTVENKILRNVANAHADMHLDNLLTTYLQLKNGRKYLIPTLIDYGLDAHYFYPSKTDFINEIYNNFLRFENNIETEYIISKNRIYNFWQNIDFCETLIIIGYTLTLMNRMILSEFCKRFRDQIDKPDYGKNLFKYITLFNLIPNNLRPILPLIHLILKGSFKAQTYRHWIEIVNLLSTDDLLVSVKEKEYLNKPRTVANVLQYYLLDSKNVDNFENLKRYDEKSLSNDIELPPLLNLNLNTTTSAQVVSPDSERTKCCLNSFCG